MDKSTQVAGLPCLAERTAVNQATCVWQDSAPNEVDTYFHHEQYGSVLPASSILWDRCYQAYSEEYRALVALGTAFWANTLDNPGIWSYEHGFTPMDKWIIGQVEADLA